MTMNLTSPTIKTTVRCLSCGSTHAASIERENGQIFGTVDCPRRPPRVRLSSNADFYLALRGKSRSLGSAAPERQRSVLSFLPITETCNFKCPVCYAACEPQPVPVHVPVAEVLERARKARANGARAICLTGGEPTLHPALLEIVRSIRGLGPRVILITNGLRLGTEPALAPALRAAGLHKVDLQFDTFDPEVHRRMRGNTFIEEKIRAAKNVLAAGIRIGTVTTVARLNLPEVDRLIRFGLSMGFKTILFQTAAPVGRFELGRDEMVDREQVLEQVLASSALPGPTLDDVWPFPHVESWGLRVHPDCGVSLVLLRGKDRTLHFAREWIDLPQLNVRLHGLTPANHWWARNIGPLKCLLKSTRPGHRAAVMRNLAGFLRGRGTGAVMIGVSTFCPPEFVDTMRVDACCSRELRAGRPVSPCIWYLKNPVKEAEQNPPR